MEEELYNKVSNMANEMRKDALKLALEAGSDAAHFGGGVSTIDILAVLYGAVMNHDSKNPNWEKRDRFILSKGHGVLAYYAALAECGYIEKSEFSTFEKDESALLGHPVQCREKGIEFTTGSLGMGLSLGIGVAHALKRKNAPGKVYVLMGDGECNEGSVWEAFMSVPQFGLDNVVAIIDRNKFQLGGLTEEVMDIGNMGEKLRAFGWNAIDVDGHDIRALHEAFTMQNDEKKKPLAIVAHTIKGKGYSFAENNNAWHHATLTQKQYDETMQELI